jgi:hypothetical protein
MAEYDAYLGRLKLKIKNPACFIEDDNLIVAGSNLGPFAEELAKFQRNIERWRKYIEQKRSQLEAELAREAKEGREAGLPAAEIARRLQLKRNKALREFREEEIRMQRKARANERRFELVTKRMFPRLYHEAFHAYLENHVYPHDEFDVPRWLNEGLAVMFEGGLLEGATLRVDTPNREALRRLKADLAGDQPLSIEKLLTADQTAFISRDHSDVANADRHYVYSWGLAYCLTFRMRQLGTPALDQYVRKPAEGVTPVQRFEKLVENGRLARRIPLAEFERRWRHYIFELCQPK